jgi:hypothetical protein
MFMAIVGTMLSATGCATQSAFVPVGPGATGGPAAEYGVPPEAPSGTVYVTSFGLTDLDVGQGRSSTMLHVRLAVSNGSAQPWVVDGRRQLLLEAGLAPKAPAFVNSDAGAGPLYQIAPGQANVLDLYYAAAPLNGFALDWSVDVLGRVVAQQTAFQRTQSYPASYGAYPPYVTVGLGFGLGWYHGPYYPYPHYRYGHPPIVRRYYYAPGRTYGGGWRGPPPRTWRATPPPSMWRGAPPPRSGWRGAPAPRSGGGWRATPPARRR